MTAVSSRGCGGGMSLPSVKTFSLFFPFALLGAHVSGLSDSSINRPNSFRIQTVSPKHHNVAFSLLPQEITLKSLAIPMQANCA
jgi:hypothetical protein